MVNSTLIPESESANDSNVDSWSGSGNHFMGHGNISEYFNRNLLYPVSTSLVESRGFVTEQRFKDIGLKDIGGENKFSCSYYDN